MEISKTFVVKASPDATWAFLTDPRRVAQCLPGAAVTEQIDEHTHAGTITMKVGPVAANFKGTMRFEKLDAAARTAEIVAKGQDVRGKGGADMRMTSRLTERAPGETEVTITSNVNIIGSLAQFGRSIVQDVADQVFEKFVVAVRGHLETPAAPATPAASNAVRSAAVSAGPAAEPAPTVPPIEVFSTASGAVGRAAGRAMFSPALWIAVLVIILLVYWLFSR
jgi:uncharacterized protein